MLDTAKNPTVPEPFLSVEHLRTSFHTPKGVVRAVDDVSFGMDAGTTLAVVGESGSGKTILSRSIMGLLAGSNVERTGSVRYRGTELVGAPHEAVRKLWGTEMAMVLQDPMTSLNPVIRIGKQIAESLIYHERISKAEARRTVIELLGSVGLGEPERRVKQYPYELSGGMRQRVTIAVALSCNPGLLIADEPTTALDVTVQAQIMDLLAEQQRQRGMAMILVTHDLGLVAGFADVIAVMYAGRIVEQAPTSTLFASMRMPYTEALFQSIPKLDAVPHTRLATIPGSPPDLIEDQPGCRFAPRCRYVQDRCREEEPPLVEADSPGHLYRCWFPVGDGCDSRTSSTQDARLAPVNVKGTR